MFMTSLVFDFIQFIDLILEIYLWVMIATGALLWLITLKVIDKKEQWVKGVGELLGKLTDPVLRPLRRALIPVKGFDLSPLVVIIVIVVVRSFLSHVYVSNGVPHYNGSNGMPFYQNKGDHIYGGRAHP
jgi:YggT family protein